MKVLIACEFSGVVRESFRARGHDAWSCDLRDAEDNSIYHIKDDVLNIIYGIGSGTYNGVEFHDLSRFEKEEVNQGIIEEDVQAWDLMIAHPPCTRLTNAGVRWLKVAPRGRSLEDLWQELREAATFYKALRDAPIEKKAIENPVMHKYARELIGPMTRQIVQPWWFGEPEFKATGFELYNLPQLVPTNKLTPPKSGTVEHRAWSKVHMMSPGADREKNRSRTLKGVAEAMSSQWG
jgi:hypothetical protein